MPQNQQVDPQDSWGLFQFNYPMIQCDVFSATEEQRPGAGCWEIRLAWSGPSLASLMSHTSTSEPQVAQPVNHSWLFWWHFKVCLGYFLGYPSFSVKEGLRSRVGRTENKLTAWPNSETGLKRETKPHILYPPETNGSCLFPGYHGFMGY